MCLTKSFGGSKRRESTDNGSGNFPNDGTEDILDILLPTLSTLGIGFEPGALGIAPLLASAWTGEVIFTVCD